MTKVFVVLTTVTAIVLSVLTVAAAAQWSNTTDLVNKYQQLYEAELVARRQMAATHAANLAIKDDALDASQRTIASNQEEIRRLSKESADLRTQLARQTNEKVSAEAGRKKLEEILDVQMAELTSLRQQYQTYVSENMDLQTRLQRLSARLLEVTGQLTIATDQIRNLQEKLYASEQQVKDYQQQLASGRKPSPVETPETVMAVSPLVAGPIRGEVTNVDGRYVTINVGETSGVTQGMTFMVYRGSTYVGDVEVARVDPKESGGKITMLSPGQDIQAGDRVAHGLEAD